MTSDPHGAAEPDLIELEIAAFMGPHIKRAQIAMVLIGLLYAWLAYSSYGQVAEFRAQLAGADAGDEALRELKRIVDLAYVIVVFTGVAGVANLVLAAFVPSKPTFAIYAAMGIFAAHTALQLYATEGLILTSWQWWLTAIVLGMGFQAAYKAHQLRKSRRPAEARVVG